MGLMLLWRWCLASVKGHVACMGHYRNAFTILVKKAVRLKQLIIDGRLLKWLLK